MQIPLIILCGGLGSRLKPVTKDLVPKFLCEVTNGKTFADYMVNVLIQKKIQHLILATGHHGDKVVEFFENKFKNYFISIVYEQEPVQCGTGGAILRVLSKIDSELFFVANGDTVLDYCFNEMLFNLKKNNADAFISSKSILDKRKKGNISIDIHNRIISFSEKSNKNNYNYISAGFYLFKKSVFYGFENLSNCSLEHDLLPIIVKKNKVFAYEIEDFIDIGTPLTLKEFSSKNGNF
jgi:NDP-sugar pyrophosphorylase family protein